MTIAIKILFGLSVGIFGLLTGIWYVWLIFLPMLISEIMPWIIEETAKLDSRWNNQRSNRRELIRAYEQEWNSLWYLKAFLLTYRIGSVPIAIYIAYYCLHSYFGLMK